MTDIGIDLHLMTRGVSRDYRFIGKSQVNRWWSAYSKWTRFEAPTIIVEPSRFYISGITSTERRDRVGTPIRYALAGQLRTGIDGIDSNAVRIVINLLGKATEELRGKRPFTGLSESFDKIGKDLIEKALADDDEASDNVLAAIRKLLEALPDDAARPPVSKRHWCSGPTEDGFRALVATAEFVLKGDEPNGVAECSKRRHSRTTPDEPSGLAAYLNLADEKDVQSVLGKRRLGGIVVKDGSRFPKVLSRPRISPAVGFLLVLIVAVIVVTW